MTITGRRVVEDAINGISVAEPIRNLEINDFAKLAVEDLLNLRENVVR